jgi:hypothetical protein
MITGNELLKDLEEAKNKAELVEVVYPGNEIWPEVNYKLNEIIKLIKQDKRLYSW